MIFMMAFGSAFLWETSSFKFLIKGENFCHVFYDVHFFIFLLHSLYFISSPFHSTPSSEFFFIFTSFSLSHFISDSFCTSGRCESTSYHFRPPVHDEFLHFALFILFALSPFHSTLPGGMNWFLQASSSRWISLYFIFLFF